MSSTIIAIDPSGSFNEGKGHTGMAVMTEHDWNSVFVLTQKASDYPTRCAYWGAILSTLKYHLAGVKDVHVVIEAFVNRAEGFTIGKMSETPMLIGCILYYLESKNIPYTLQYPSTVKPRYPDRLLAQAYPKFECRATNRYYLNGKCTNDHERDALRHLAYYVNYGS